MNISTILVYSLFALSEIAISRILRSGEADKKADDNTLVLLWVVILAGIGLALGIYFRVAAPIAHAAFASYAGLALMITGITLRLLIVRQLGRMFTADVSIRQNHQLRTDGFYRYLRHPSYSALLLSFVGFGLSLNNWLSLAVLLMVILPVLMRRIKTEEAVLTTHFGQQYADYKKQTRALIPFLL